MLQQPRIRIPRSARAGEVIEIRTLIEHPMETGIRQDGSRAPPRDMLNRFLVRMNGETVFAADLRNGTSANPYHVFYVRIDRAAEFEFVWTDERGRSARATARVALA
jgi:sulfur-oxidizing protein SoxZ